jgi:hypothetical protein
MEFRPSSTEGPAAEVVVSGPDGTSGSTVGLSGRRVTVGRLPGVNDIALEPDPELLVTRAGHCVFELHGAQWFVVDGGSVNGTFIRRGSGLQRIDGRAALREGDVVCVLASVAENGARRYFELAFHSSPDSQATRAVPVDEPATSQCLRYETDEARLVLVQGRESHEIQIRAQAHRLVRYMAERNAAGEGGAALCTHEELMHAIWADEPMHTREELARLIWELRKKLEPFNAGHLIESERRRGYRMRTCGD